MKKCPLCSQRNAKRHCPAKAQKICSICCGTHREIEIDCPSDCVHLRKGRSFETQRGERRPKTASQFNEQFFYRYAGIIAAAAGNILEERLASPQMVDQDALRALAALKATMKTLDAGIYYESLPEGTGPATALYRRLKTLFEELMQWQGERPNALRTAEVLEILEFMVSTGKYYAGDRPRSRRYLDWLSEMTPETPDEEPSRLIVP